MDVYVANVDEGILPMRGWNLLAEAGYRVTGNWAPLPYRAAWGDSRADLLIYAPHGQQADMGWRSAALRLAPETIRSVPTVLWALYPDYLTGWDFGRQEHANEPLGPIQDTLPYFRVLLANSQYTADVLHERAPEYAFDVCELGIDVQGILGAGISQPDGARGLTVLWHHRWAIDKNLPQALEVIRDLAPRYPEVVFLIGRQDNWDADYWSPPWFRERYGPQAEELGRLPNVGYLPFLPDTRAYWRNISGVDISFSCSFHETFGISMLEQGCAGAACVVPRRAAYPEVHAGCLVVEPDEIGAGVERLITDAGLRASVAAASAENAARYDIQHTAAALITHIQRVG